MKKPLLLWYQEALTEPIHKGHIDHIRRSKRLGDFLIVSVNPDEDMIRKKGYCFMPLEDRVAIVRELRSVDCVIVSVPDEGRQGKTLAVIRPDIFAKGGDRTPSNMVQEEIDICEELGIKIVYGVGEKLNSSQEIVRDARAKIKI